MDRLVFSEPIVQSALHNYVAVRVDVDRQPDLAARYRIDATPTYAMVDLQGHQVAQAAGFTGVEGFLMFLKEASKQLTQADPTSAPPPEDAPTDNP
jgi:thioredoxin-related protein